FSQFPPNSFLGNAKLCGAPLSPCSRSVGLVRKSLSDTAVAGIVVAIVFTSTMICLTMLYIMLRIRCNWRRVSISNSDGSTGDEFKKGEEKWVYGNDHQKKIHGEYWKVLNFMNVLGSAEQVSSNACIFQLKANNTV
ncbi:hypothetical protein MKX01_040659, partial [Papaver californicum]